MLNRSMKVLLAFALASAGAVAAFTRAQASTTVPPTSIGFDISFPQCSATLPTPQGFAIIGVNNGHPFSVNPCLARELQWSKSSLSGSPEFYVNASNPGPSSAQWPTGQQTPQVCLGANSVACSFDYGWNAGKGSFTRAVAAELATGASSATAAAAAAPWWLDVESGNQWQTIRILHAPTPAEFANDQATLQGELAYLSSRGVTSLGIYSTMTQWKGLMGVTGTTFAAERSWLTPYGSLTAAQAGCAAPSFTGGRVAMIQYPSLGLDGDYRCPLLSTPSTATVSVAASATFSTQLGVAGESAPVTFVQTGGASSLVVTPTGLLTTSGALAPGVYTATGTTSAGNDRGTFTFALAVGTITQSSPTTGSATVGTSASFSAQLLTTGASGPVTFVQTAGAPSLIVSPTGLVTTAGNLAKGNYTATGTTTDANGDQGTFSFVLHVGAMTQSLPVIVSVTPLTSATFSDQLAMVGAAGPVTFVQTRGAPSLLVSPSGLLTTSGQLAPGSYVARGAASDPLGDKGTFFFNLRVQTPKMITQSAPTSGSVSVGTSASFSTQLATTGAAGAVTFTQTSGAPLLVVSPTGLVTTSGTLAKGNYTATGTTTDANGDQGAFSFALHVGAMTQSPPVSISVTPLTSATFSDQLAMVGAAGPVTFVQTRGAPSLLVSPTGLVTTSGSLAPGSYVVRGTANDPLGDKGTFFFNLRVKTPKPITQAAPTSSSATVATSVSFKAQLATTGASGAVTFVQASGAPSLVVSPTGLVTTSGTLAKGNYTATGTTTDANGDQGTFSFVLTVIPSVTTPPGLTLPVASRVIGRAIAGRTVTIAVSGLGFYGRPRVLTRPGTTARVMKDNGTRLTIRIHVQPGSPPGSYVMTIVLANHKSCRVRYVQR